MDFEDETKDFELEKTPEREHVPDPQEFMDLEHGEGSVWVVKIPETLIKQWSSIDRSDIHIATIRKYALPDKQTRYVLFLPTHGPQHPQWPVFDSKATYLPEKPSSGPYVYDVDVATRGTDKDHYVFSKGPELPGRVHKTAMIGRIQKDCTLRLIRTGNHRRSVKAHFGAEKRSPRPAVRFEKDFIKLARDAGVSSKRNNFVASAKKPSKGKFERMARISKDKLLDILFSLFKENSHWSIGELRKETQQPEQYLKETLQEIAILHKSGKFHGLWELRDHFEDVERRLKKTGDEFSDISTAKEDRYPSIEGDEEDDGGDELEEVL